MGWEQQRCCSVAVDSCGKVQLPIAKEATSIEEEAINKFKLAHFISGKAGRLDITDVMI